MKISAHIHRRLRLKNLLSTFFLMGLLSGLAWLSTRYQTQIDVTASHTNTLSAESQNVVNALSDPIVIKAYIKRDAATRAQIEQLINRYRLIKPNLELDYIDPEAQPELARKLEIGPAGALFVEYKGRTERINFLDESSLTNALQQLASSHKRWITFLTGHGERSPADIANFDLSRLANELTQRNISSQTLNLAEIPDIPDNSALLIIASPAVPFLPGELTIIINYIQKGGNLLWLTDPDSSMPLQLAHILGLRVLPGTVQDNQAELYGVNDPGFILISRYSRHPATQNLKNLTLFPVTQAFSVQEETDFTAEALLTSSEQSWTETGQNAPASFDADTNEQEGPLTIAYAMTRQLQQEQEQRIIVIGDGDFIANAYLGNVGNLELGLKIINWLIRDNRFVSIPEKKTPDQKLQLSPLIVAVIGFGFLLILPGILLTTGFIIWRKRRNR